MSYCFNNRYFHVIVSYRQKCKNIMAKPKKKGGPKQKLSARAAAAKRVRDKKMAMTPSRRAKKAENQRIGQSSKYDIHHIGGKVGKTSKTSVANNRGGHGKGTKKEKK